MSYIVPQIGVEAMATSSKIADAADNGVTLDTLIDRLGKGAAEEFFGRIDGSLRTGDVVHGTNVRESRVAFSKARLDGHAQLVVPGRASDGRRGAADIGDSVVVIKMDDFQAVVRAGRDEFDWGRAFAPHSGLEAATSGAAIVRGARGARLLRA